MNRLVIDLDDTLTLSDPALSYADKQPNLLLVDRLRAYKAAGFEIIVHTARNMRSFENSVGKITAHTVPAIVEWLRRHDIPFDELHVGKPWCGENGFYVDDRAIRPSEFVDLSFEQITALVRPAR